MTTALLQSIVDGLGRGAVYALLALGLVVVTTATRTVNFAQGSLVLVGGFGAYALQDTFGWVAAAAAGIAAAALGGLLIGCLVRLGARRTEHDGLALLTLGVDLIVAEAIVRRLGTEVSYLRVPFLDVPFLDLPVLGGPYGAQPIVVAGLRIFRAQVAALVVGAVLITVLLLVVRFSGWGLALRAQAANPEAAAQVGIRSSRVAATAWLVGGALAGVAVLLLATHDPSGVGLGRGTQAVALLALPAALLGGLDSPGGAVVGGIVVGLTEALSARYLSVGFSTSAAFLIVLPVLVIRPSGLFGTREPGRG